jgi:hypothetical protein
MSDSTKSSEREALERIAKACDYDGWAHEGNIAARVEWLLKEKNQRIGFLVGALRSIARLVSLCPVEFEPGMWPGVEDVETILNKMRELTSRDKDVEVCQAENSYRHPRQAHFEELKQAVVDYEQLFVDSFGAHPSGKEPRDVVAHVCIQHVMEGKNGYLYFWEGKLMLCFVAYREKWDVLKSADTWKVSELNEDLMGPVAAHIKHLYLKLLKRDSDVCDRLALQAKSLREEITERRKVLEKRVSR